MPWEQSWSASHGTAKNMGQEEKEQGPASVIAAPALCDGDCAERDFTELCYNLGLRAVYSSNVDGLLTTPGPGLRHAWGATPRYQSEEPLRAAVVSQRSAGGLSEAPPGRSAPDTSEQRA